MVEESSMPTEQQINEAWTAHRSYLIDLAFRMLSDIGRAEDVVQEAFTRLSQSDVDAIVDQRGWLIVVTSRLCLDQIGSARARREYPASVYDLDNQASQAGVDPADRVTLDDSVRLALLVVLERLTPAERVAYVLHDVFQIPFESISETVGRPPATCRQLARRARQKLESSDGPARMDVTAAEHHQVTERFIAACADGSFEQLMAVLDPDVSGGVDIRPGLIVTGASRVANNILTYWGGRPRLVSLPTGGQPGVLAFVDRRLAAILLLTIKDDRITKIHVHADPAKLTFLRGQLHW
jgi:RNA polymerase sigma-70 factor, ECF subfamily